MIQWCLSFLYLVQILNLSHGFFSPIGGLCKYCIQPLKSVPASQENLPSKAPTLNGKVIFPTKTLLQGLQGQPIKIAAVYALLNNQYKRGSGDGWEYCEHVGITKDLTSTINTHINSLGNDSVAFVRALSFSYPQKSVMEDIASGWRNLVAQNNSGGIPERQPQSKKMVDSIEEDRNQKLVEFIRSAQYDDDDMDDDDDEEEDPQQNVGGNSPTNVLESDIISPFVNESTQTTGKKPLDFSVINVEKVLDEVRPYLISDGGNVSVQRVDMDKKDIYLLLEGACGSCSSSTVTMQLGIERTLREYFVDLGQVIQVEREISNLDTSKAQYLTLESVNAELNRISPAVTAMGAICEVSSVDPNTGRVILRYRGSTKVQNAVKLALLDVPYVKHIEIIPLEDDRI